MAHALGEAWLRRCGPGPIALDKEKLRAELLAEAKALGLDASEKTAVEVDNFLANGHASERNFGRLQRRLEAHLRGDDCGKSEASAALSARSVPFSASSATRGLTPRMAGGAIVLGSSAPLPRSPGIAGAGAGHTGEERQPIKTWSGLAQFNKLSEVQEAEIARTARLEKQRKLREDLEQQMREKSEARSRLTVQQKVIRQEDEELAQQWKAEEKKKQEEHTKRVLAVKSDRQEQIVVRRELRDQERQERLADGIRLAELAAKGLQEEAENARVKKIHERESAKKVVEQADEMRRRKEEERQRLNEEERRRAKELQKTIEQEEAKKQEILKKALADRDIQFAELKANSEAICSPEVLAAARAEKMRRGREQLKQIREEHQRAQEADRREAERQRQKCMVNADFLSQQIAERQQIKQQAAAKKAQLRLAAEEDADGYRDAQRAAVELRRSRNLAHRLELEKQIYPDGPGSSRRIPGAQQKKIEDQMTDAEFSLNRTLLQEASRRMGEVSVAAAN